MKRKNLILTMLSIFAFMFVFGVKVDAAMTNPQPTSISTSRAAKGGAACTPTSQNDRCRVRYDNIGYGDGSGYNTSRYLMNITYGDGDSVSTAVGICYSPEKEGPLQNRDSYSWSSAKIRSLDNPQIASILYWGLHINGADWDAAKEVYAANHSGATITEDQRTVMVHSAISYVKKQGGAGWDIGLNNAGRKDARDLADAVEDHVGGPTGYTTNGPTGYFAYFIEREGNIQDLAVIYSRQRKIKVNKVASAEDMARAQANGDSLAGARYRIYDSPCKPNTNVPYSTRRAYNNGEVVPDLVTKADGTTDDATLLQNKVYAIKEISVPSANWEIDETCHECNLQDGQTSCTVTSTDRYKEEEQPGKGKLTVTKKSGNPSLTDNNSNYSLAGAKFTIYSVNDLSSVTSYATCTGTSYGTITTTTNGTGSKTNIPEGKYCVKETTQPTNFELDTTSYKTFEVVSGQSEVQQFTFEATDQPIELTNGFRIYKASSDNSITIDGTNYKIIGAKFAVYNGGSCSGNPIKNVEITSRTYVNVNDLAYGTYSVKETEAPTGFKLSNECKSVTVGSSTSTVTISNAPKKGYISVFKKGSDDAEWSLEGAEFELYKGTTCSGSAVKTFHIKADGSTDDVAEVNFGDYSIKETKVPSNGKYEMNKACYTVSVKESDNSTQTKPVLKTITEEAKDGYGRIIKVSTTKTDKSLEGGTFILCKTEEECKKDKPEVVCCELEDGQTEADRKCALVTDKKGVTNTCKLKPGVYYYKETKAPAGFEVNPTVRSITVEPGAKVEDECPENLIPENPKTGIENPIMIAIAAVAIGGAGLYLNRRKNAFRQV